MKTIKITILSLLTACTVVSCDFLEKEPYKVVPENYFKNQAEAASFLTGIYANLGQSAFYGSNYMAMAAGDDLSYYGGSTGRISNAGLICNNATTSDSGTSNLWLNLYSGIERANMFLEQLDAVPGMSDAVRNQYRAEARFMRAFYYFHLVQGWGDVPFKTESTYSSGTVTNKEIARTDKNKIYEFIAKEMSEAADSGLLSAAELSYKPGRVSKSAAWGMLARVYLFWAGEHNRDKKPATEATHTYFERASFYGQKVMGEGHSLAANYWDTFIDLCSDQYNTTAKESIWEVEFAGDGTGDIRSEGSIGNNMGLISPDFSSLSSATGKLDPGYSYGYMWCTPKLYELYEQNGDLERFTWNLAPFSYRGLAGTGVIGRTFTSKEMYDLIVDNPNWSDARSYSYDGVDKGKAYVGGATPPTQYGDVYNATVPKPETLRKDLCCAKYRREYETAKKKSKNSTSINFPILRYSDVLLMVAEAENEYNGTPTELAKRCLKEVRDRAGIADITPDLITQEMFRRAVKDERAMELCFEYTRRFDLIRWGEFTEKMNEQAVRAQSGSNWGSLNTQAAPFFRVTDTYLYYPIPDSERVVNSLITENNPGW